MMESVPIAPAAMMYNANVQVHADDRSTKHSTLQDQIRRRRRGLPGCRRPGHPARRDIFLGERVMMSAKF